MINHLAATLRVRFRAWKVPVQVDLGPETTDWCGPGNRLVVWRDEPGQEGYLPAKGSPAGEGAGHARGVRMLAATARFYASSGQDGAMRSDHENDCDAYVDLFLLALYDWAKTQKLVHCPVGLCGYVKPKPSQDHPENVVTFSGVIYEVHFQVPRGVHERAKDTVRLTGVSTTAKLLDAAGGLETVDPPVIAPAHIPPE